MFDKPSRLFFTKVHYSFFGKNVKLNFDGIVQADVS
ncbi:putative uncharacterized protein [Parachlamydia acanthamoebae UV-7]|uniref:Uncharacterized protein n=1 Tax=Parachlamydia acanthamoebae (strain UV7) TaxID=765952 RepID=F8KUU7_PARAV|nr:putative uncharacterized protein [Parachlamydia acanthamoebae UV-7]